MKKIILATFLFVVTICSAQVKKLPNFYGKKVIESVCPLSANSYNNQNLKNMITQILEKRGEKNRYELMSCQSVNNCQAVIDPTEHKPYILYNPDFLQNVKRLDFTRKQLPNIGGQDWVTLTILAHELGHLVNRHLDNPVAGMRPIEMELEADEFAGFSMYLLCATLEQAQLVMHSKEISDEDNDDHPGRQKRLEAIEKGYNNAKNHFPNLCGVPPVSTYNVNLTVNGSFGHATLSGAGNYKKGESVNINIDPDNTVEFKGWKENGQYISYSQSYTINGIVSDRNIIADLAEKPNESYIKVINATPGILEVRYDRNTSFKLKPKMEKTFKSMANVSHVISCMGYAELNDGTIAGSVLNWNEETVVSPAGGKTFEKKYVTNGDYYFLEVQFKESKLYDGYIDEVIVDENSDKQKGYKNMLKRITHYRPTPKDNIASRPMPIGTIDYEYDSNISYGEMGYYKRYNNSEISVYYLRSYREGDVRRHNFKSDFLQLPQSDYKNVKIILQFDYDWSIKREYD